MKRLYKRGHRYYYRLKIPADLRHIFGGRREIWKSLSTSSEKRASERCIMVHTQVRCFFKFARCNMIPDSEMRAMATAFVCEQLGQFEQAREGAVRLCATDVEWSQLSIETMDKIIAAFRGDLARRSPFRSQVENMVNAVLKDKSLQIPPDSPEYQRLLRYFTQALVHFVKIEKERRLGRYDNDFDGLMPDIVAKKGAADSKSHVQADMAISRVIAEYVEEKTTGGRWDAKTRQQNESSLALMIEILGDRPANSITHKDMLSLRKTIGRLPPNRGKNPVYRDMAIAELLELKDQKPISTVTVNNILTRMASFWGWAETHEFIRKSPSRSLIVPTKRRADEERSIYQCPKELQLLLDTVSEQGKPESRPERIWIPLIAMHSGMRPNEIAQLYLDDIVTENDILCIRVSDTHPDQKVKNKNARRRIPVHPLLLQLGFMSYLAKVEGNLHGRLFPQLRRHRDGYYATFGRWFQGINRNFITKDRRKTFYSLRHNFMTALKEAMVDYTVTAEIVGHGIPGETMERYAKRYSAEVLFDAVSQLDYGLDLDASRKATELTHR